MFLPGGALACGARYPHLRGLFCALQDSYLSQNRPFSLSKYFSALPKELIEVVPPSMWSTRTGIRNPRVSFPFLKPQLFPLYTEESASYFWLNL